MDYVSAVFFDEDIYNDHSKIKKIDISELRASLRLSLFAQSFTLKIAMLAEWVLLILFWKAYSRIWHEQMAAYLRTIAIPLSIAALARTLDVVQNVLTQDPTPSFLATLEAAAVLWSVLNFSVGTLIFIGCIFRSIEHYLHESAAQILNVMSGVCGAVTVILFVPVSYVPMMVSSIICNVFIAYGVAVLPFCAYLFILSVIRRVRRDASAMAWARTGSLQRARMQLIVILLGVVPQYQTWIESTTRILLFFSSGLPPIMMTRYFMYFPFIIFEKPYFDRTYATNAILNQLAFPIVFLLAVFTFLPQWRDGLRGKTLLSSMDNAFKMEPSQSSISSASSMQATGSTPQEAAMAIARVEPPPSYQEATMFSQPQPNAPTLPHAAPAYPAPIYSPTPLRADDPNWAQYNGLPPEYYSNATSSMMLQRSTMFGPVDDSTLPGASPLEPGPSTVNQQLATESMTYLRKQRMPNREPDVIQIRVMSAPVRRTHPGRQSFEALPTVKE